MSIGISVYLDLLRAFAAIVVFLVHAADHRLLGGLIPSGAAFASDAVILFFVLSGVVIASVLDKKDATFERFALSRAARLYSVAIPAIAITLLFDAIGRHFDSSLYSNWYPAPPEKWVVRILSPLMFANEFWFHSVRPFSNGPYWSLSYEAVYYALAAAFCFGSRRLRIGAIVLITLVAGPKIIILFPIWLSGFIVYHYRNWLSPEWAVVLFYASIGIYAAYIFAGRPFLPSLTIEGYSWSSKALEWSAIGLCTAVNIWSATTLLSRRSFPIPSYPIRWIAGRSFSIYAYHYPLQFAVGAVMPGPPENLFRGVLLVVISFLLCLLAAEFTELRKDSVRKLLVRGVSRWRKWFGREKRGVWRSGEPQ
jgi:peptidoglycan/LPS O-acetylase OafA/YrhL